MIAKTVLSPLIYLVVIVLSPPGFGKWQKVCLSIPLIFNTIVYLSAPINGHLVFWYAEDYSFSRGPLGHTIYIVTFFYLGLLLYWSAKSFHEKDKRMSLVLLFVAGIAILTGALEGHNIASGHTDEAFVLGVFLFYMYLVTLRARCRRELDSKRA